MHFLSVYLMMLFLCNNAAQETISDRTSLCSTQAVVTSAWKNMLDNVCRNKKETNEKQLQI